MHVIRGRGSGAGMNLRLDNFTGTVWGDPLMTTPEGVGMSSVYFSPGARTHWHRHEHGQLITVIAGEGIVATRNGDVARVRAGDQVWTEPGVEHWHGSLENTLMVHTVLSIGDTDWLDEVTDEAYIGTHGADPLPN